MRGWWDPSRPSRPPTKFKGSYKYGTPANITEWGLRPLPVGYRSCGSSSPSSRGRLVNEWYLFCSYLQYLLMHIPYVPVLCIPLYLFCVCLLGLFCVYLLYLFCVYLMYLFFVYLLYLFFDHEWVRRGEPIGCMRVYQINLTAQA